MMKNDILYSFVVPVYKVEKYIKNCVDTLVNQSYKNIEIILVDDGSPDNSGKLCDDMAKNDSRIKVIHKENGGVSSARFAGVEAAKGKYILCVDADDWVSLDCVEIINEVVVNNNYPDVVTYGHIKMTEQGSIHGTPCVPEGLYLNDKKREIIFPILIQDENAKAYCPCVWGECVCRELFLKNMIVAREAVTGEDMACIVPTIYHANAVYVLYKCLYYYRYNEESVTKSKTVFPWSCSKILAEHLDKKMDLSEADFQMQVCRYVVHKLFNTAVSQFHRNDSISSIKRNIAENLNDDFYKKAISECKFKMFSKGWIAQYALKHRLWNIVRLYGKLK